MFGASGEGGDEGGVLGKVLGERQGPARGQPPPPDVGEVEPVVALEVGQQRRSVPGLDQLAES